MTEPQLRPQLQILTAMPELFLYWWVADWSHRLFRFIVIRIIICLAYVIFSLKCTKINKLKGRKLLFAITLVFIYLYVLYCIYVCIVITVNLIFWQQAQLQQAATVSGVGNVVASVGTIGNVGSVGSVGNVGNVGGVVTNVGTVSGVVGNVVGSVNTNTDTALKQQPSPTTPRLSPQVR